MSTRWKTLGNQNDSMIVDLLEDEDLHNQ